MIKIACPSGFEGSARRLKLHEVQAVADELEGDRELFEAGWSSILSGPWQETTDAGHYSYVSTGTTIPEWSRLLKGDVLSALFQLRIGSFRDGEVYDFDYQCGGCGHLVPWTINLQDEIMPTVQLLSDEGKAWLRGEQQLVAKLLDGTEVEFCLGTFGGDRDMNKLRRQLIRREERETAELLPQDTIAAQTLRINGQQLDIRRRYQWASDLDMDDMLDLMGRMEDCDCGYDTRIEVRCTRCRARQKINLPLGQDFLVPRQRRRKRRQAAGIADETTSAPSGAPSGSAGAATSSAADD